MRLNHTHALSAILGDAQHIATLMMMGDKPDRELAESVAAELSEFIELLEGRSSAIDDWECVDPKLIALAKHFRGEIK